MSLVAGHSSLFLYNGTLIRSMKSQNDKPRAPVAFDSFRRQDSLNASGGQVESRKLKVESQKLSTSSFRLSIRNMVIVVIPVLVILVTFLFWYMTWFGRRLADSEIGKYLADTSVPHKTQHALSQLTQEIARGDVTAKRWYPRVIALAGNQEAELRSMAAWVMGQDNHSPEFHEALLKLVQDPAAMVRWNAALALVRFGDLTAEPQLRLMLRPYNLLAPRAGTVSFQLKEQDAVRAGSIVARISNGNAEPIEVHSPLAGQVERWVAKDRAKVIAGDEIAILSPGQEQVWEALRALYLVGRTDDLEDVDRFARGVSGMPERVRQQATLTAEAIRRRAVTSH